MSGFPGSDFNTVRHEAYGNNVFISPEVRKYRWKQRLIHLRHDTYRNKNHDVSEFLKQKKPNDLDLLMNLIWDKEKQDYLY